MKQFADNWHLPCCQFSEMSPSYMIISIHRCQVWAAQWLSSLLSSAHWDQCVIPFYSERPRGAGFRWVNPAERWRENPARALARAGFSQHLECGIHRSESSTSGSFALITNYAIIIQFVLHWRRVIDRGRRKAMFTNGTCLWRRGDSTIAHGNRNVTTACPRHPGYCESTEGLWPISDAH